MSAAEGCFIYTFLHFASVIHQLCTEPAKLRPRLLCLHWTGNALPPPGTTDSGSDDPASESSDMAAADPKTYLVMSGGEGYIDFRLGECVAEAGDLLHLWGKRVPSPPGTTLL